jgi:glycosyltransferase involved in cell wall biosynthesis
MKRLDLLIQSFVHVLARYPQARLMIVGEGSLRPQLEALAAALGISHAVIWTGFRKDISRLLAAMDLYVQASSNEGLSLSILEAMAAGKAVVATKVGGAEEVITDGTTGILIAPGSTSVIASAVSDLLEHADKRSFLAQAARSHVLQQFNVQRMTDAYRRIYENLASEQPHRN